ncbi:hypothetical protein B0H16DRAFT_1704496 [Mycena metata]|uniref:Uncharacterized protein n=1 Tax=Mycena metata TaxID=1033252 RepID=A0AAD7GUW1_9AGAR|nr:hypothetical protein B0H16DRAFT_1704496 [Mycena metata]
MPAQLRAPANLNIGSKLEARADTDTSIALVPDATVADDNSPSEDDDLGLFGRDSKVGFGGWVRETPFQSFVQPSWRRSRINASQRRQMKQELKQLEWRRYVNIHRREGVRVSVVLQSRHIRAIAVPAKGQSIEALALASFRATKQTFVPVCLADEAREQFAVGWWGGPGVFSGLLLNIDVTDKLLAGGMEILNVLRRWRKVWVDQDPSDSLGRKQRRYDELRRTGLGLSGEPVA